MAHKLIDFPVEFQRSIDDEALLRMNRIRMRVERMKKARFEQEIQKIWIMGVKLKDLVSRKPIDVNKLAGRIIAIDAPNIIMGLFNFARKNPDGTHAGLLLDETDGL